MISSPEQKTRPASGAGEAQPHVLLVQRSANLDGSAFSALLLANGFRAAGWRTLVAFGFEGPILDQFWQAGHEAVVLPHDNWLRRPHPLRFLKDYLAEWRNASAFRPYLADRKVDLVYVNSAVSLAGAVAARQSGTPCVWHLRELFARGGGEMECPAALRPMVRATFRSLATTLVANSKAVARDLLGRSLAEQATVVPNAAQEVFFRENRPSAAARELFGLPSLGHVLGVPGTLRPMKGHGFLFDALPALLEAWPDLCVAVTGDGEAGYRRALEDQVSRLGLRPNVRFLGTVRTMPAFYRACDLVCIPSRAEPFGRTVIESFATGVPVVASAVGGIPEIVEPERSGLLVPYGDVEALHWALDRLLRDESLRRRLAGSARARAQALYRESAYQEALVGLAAQRIRQPQSKTP